MQYFSHLDPSISSGNLGDQIITSAVKQAISSMNINCHLISYPTQIKLSSKAIKRISKTEIALVGGSNLMCPNLLHERQWKIGIEEAIKLNNVMLFGVGWHSYGRKIDGYSKWIYKKLLNNNFIHSVRDEYTKQQLNSIGIMNVINTGCPTLWTLTENHCRSINAHKMDTVVFTLSDWRKQPENDVKLIELLARNYEKLVFWPQGKGDAEYLATLELSHINIEHLPATLEAFDNILATRKVDYIGVRLHGGIRALHHKCRSLILAVDNRAVEMQKDFNIPAIAPDAFTEISNWINSTQIVDIKLDYDSINEWKQQFKVQQINVA